MTEVSFMVKLLLSLVCSCQPTSYSMEPALVPADSVFEPDMVRVFPLSMILVSVLIVKFLPLKRMGGLLASLSEIVYSPLVISITALLLAASIAAFRDG